jgi:hypothetical protein
VRVFASFAALTLWVLGAEVAPSLHLAWHAALAPHTHDAAPRDASAEGRCHDEGAGAHCHHAPRRSTRGWDRPADAQDAARPREPAHGDGSLAHRALAFLRPAPGMAPLVEAPFVALAPPFVQASLRGHAPARAPSTRGPPG